ncbi:conserved hypothetical protein [Trichinella spiralis]|uniref:hypothetical protein n=1 Tax=Trichinella spiralis TaxID=6334 RepID=UPI0001EFC2A5|nr:conserved hypothetical protein [Trichinella spiralis]
MIYGYFSRKISKLASLQEEHRRHAYAYVHTFELETSNSSTLSSMIIIIRQTKKTHLLPRTTITVTRTHTHYCNTLLNASSNIFAKMFVASCSTLQSFKFLQSTQIATFFLFAFSSPKILRTPMKMMMFFTNDENTVTYLPVYQCTIALVLNMMINLLSDNLELNSQ